MSDSKRDWHQWTALRWQQFHVCNKHGFIKFLGDSDDEYDEDSDLSPSPPWVLMAACELASFAHRLLLRQEYREKRDMARKTHGRHRKTRKPHHKVLVYVRHLRAIAEGGHPLSTVDRLKFYLNGPPY